MQLLRDHALADGVAPQERHVAEMEGEPGFSLVKRFLLNPRQRKRQVLPQEPWCLMQAGATRRPSARNSTL